MLWFWCYAAISERLCLRVRIFRNHTRILLHSQTRILAWRIYSLRVCTSISTHTHKHTLWLNINIYVYRFFSPSFSCRFFENHLRLFTQFTTLPMSKCARTILFHAISSHPPPHTTHIHTLFHIYSTYIHYIYGAIFSPPKTSATICRCG